VFEKLEKEKKFHDWTWAALNLQPSDLRLNAYRSLPGGQVYTALLAYLFFLTSQ